MMFPYSLEGAAKTWYEKEPPNSILTWEDLVTKFMNQFFPPSKTTHLKNKISRFTQKLDESFSEAWERFKEMLRACSHHGFTELTQVDTFYNGLNDNDQDFLNAAAGGNLLSKTVGKIDCNRLNTGSITVNDDEASNHEDASDTGAAPKQQQQAIPQTNAISNIKLPILKKEEYDIWAMEMEHYLEYINNEEHIRRFHRMDDAKEIWVAIRTRFGGNANSKKMLKAVFKQQFEAFTISSSEGLEKGYDKFQQLLSQLEAHGAEVSTEDANHKFLRSLPPAWSNLAMTIRTKPDFYTLSIDDLYNNLRVFEQEIQGASKTPSSAQNVAFVSQSKSSTNKVKSSFTGAYSTCTPSSSSTNIPEKEALAGFADEVIYSFFAKQSEDWDLLHEDLE
ncbi:reverse transcriptase domain-containing protein [Tanacetum coccineum]